MMMVMMMVMMVVVMILMLTLLVDLTCGRVSPMRVRRGTHRIHVMMMKMVIW